MASQRTRLFPFVLAGAMISWLLPSCSPSYQAPPVDSALIKISQSPVSQLQRGYIVHQAKCAKCHAFEDPANYEIAELTDEIMPDMAKKSKLDLADQQAVLAYLLVARNVPKSATVAP
jgi:hypothetical protein